MITSGMISRIKNIISCKSWCAGHHAYLVLLVILGISLLPVPFRKRTSVKIPVVFSKPSFFPLISSKIQGKKLAFSVDTGACESLYLIQPIFDQISRNEAKRSVTINDFRGNSYKWKVYDVPDVKIGTIQLSTCEVVEEGLDFLGNTNLWSPNKNAKPHFYHGTVGWQFFDGGCTLFNFPKSSIFVAKTMLELQNDNVLKMEDYIAAPFTIENGCIVLSIETDLGKQRVLLDTGAAFSALNKSKLDPDKIMQLPCGKAYYPMTQVQIEGYDFGSWGFAVTELSGLWEIDGILGIDFFLETPVCFDFPNQAVYFKKPGGILSTQWKRGEYYITQFFVKAFSDLPKVEDL